MKTVMKKMLLALTLAAPMLVAGTAMAHGKFKDPGAMIQRFDANKNGKLEFSELPERMRERVKGADTNGDGALVESELTAFRETKKREFIAKWDSNKDGKLDDSEKQSARAAHAKERFNRMDKDGNGALTQQEVGDKRWTRISVADADKNGSVTANELSEAKKNGLLKHGHRGRGDKK